VKVGIFLGTQHSAGADMRRQFENHIEQVHAIRDGGYDSVWLAQHYLTYPDQFFQTVPMISRLAAETGEMDIGTNILVLPLHNIVDIAEQFATVDIISNGKLILGAALGYRDLEYKTFGVEKKTRAARFDEQLDALRLLWEKDDATFQGRHVQFEHVSIRPRPLQSPRPPIWIGAAADPAIKRAALKGDAWIATSVTTTSAMKPQVELYHRTRREAGLPRGIFAKCVELYVAETRERAFSEGAPHIAEKYRAYYSWGMGENVPGVSGKDLDIADLIKDRFIVGSPEDCVRECLAQRDTLGVDYLIVRMNFPGMTQANALKAFRLFAKEVLPHIR
jgi:alkanesulfonate monooxygenase SsuD/methylene tetrahydromethanopterin reductase-like flavin-dependent oxidoreductase (luciferase family)